MFQHKLLNLNCFSVLQLCHQNIFFQTLKTSNHIRCQRVVLVLSYKSVSCMFVSQKLIKESFISPSCLNHMYRNIHVRGTLAFFKLHEKTLCQLYYSFHCHKPDSEYFKLWCHQKVVLEQPSLSQIHQDFQAYIDSVFYCFLFSLTSSPRLYSTFQSFQHP